MALFPGNWLDNGSMRRVILHWTAGTYNASANDKKHYHFLIEGDGTLIRGRPVKWNEAPISGSYAAHTRAANSGAIGVSVCSMAGAHDTPGLNAGNFPMKKSQWEIMAQITAELCQHYNIPIKRSTVLAHGEVQDILGITQSGKWDPLRLPWKPNLSKPSVGNLFRDRVRHYFAGGISADNYVKYTVKAGETLWSIAYKLLGAGERWSEFKDANKNPVDEQDAASLSVGDILYVPSGSAGSATTFEKYTVKAGDTLWSIAFSELGSGSKWREIRDADNKTFSEETASSISVGSIILVPKH